MSVEQGVCFVQVAKYKSGKKKLMKYFFGQVQKEHNGRADGKAVVMILERHLSSNSNKD